MKQLLLILVLITTLVVATPNSNASEKCASEFKSDQSNETNQALPTYASNDQTIKAAIFQYKQLLYTISLLQRDSHRRLEASLASDSLISAFKSELNHRRLLLLSYGVSNQGLKINHDELQQFKKWSEAKGIDITTEEKSSEVQTKRIQETLLGDWQKVQDIYDGTISINGSAISSSGKIFVRAAQGTLTVYNSKSLKKIASFSNAPEWAISLDISRSGRFLAAALLQNKLILYDLEKKVEKFTVPLSKGLTNAVVISPDERHIATATHSTIELWDRLKGKSVQTFSSQGHTSIIYSLAFSPDSKYLASASDDQSVILWRVSDGSIEAKYTDHTRAATSVSFSPDGRYLASSDLSGKILLRDLHSNSTAPIEIETNIPLQKIAFIKNGRLLQITSTEKQLYVLDLSTMKYVESFDPIDFRVGSINYSLKGKYIIRTLPNSIEVWRRERLLGPSGKN